MAKASSVQTFPASLPLLFVLVVCGRRDSATCLLYLFDTLLLQISSATEDALWPRGPQLTIHLQTRHHVVQPLQPAQPSSGRRLVRAKRAQKLLTATSSVPNVQRGAFSRHATRRRFDYARCSPHIGRPFRKFCTSSNRLDRTDRQPGAVAYRSARRTDGILRRSYPGRPL